MKKDNIEENDWNPDFDADAVHISFLKEEIERLEMENDALLAEMIS